MCKLGSLETSSSTESSGLHLQTIVGAALQVVCVWYAETRSMHGVRFACALATLGGRFLHCALTVDSHVL